MRTFGNKHYFTRAETRAMSIDHPIGDPTGGTAYGERNDPVTATVAGVGSGIIGGYLQGEAAKDAAKTQAGAQLEAARIAAESARFKPIGMTTRFGSSNFQYDPQGNLTSAGYSVDPRLRAQQDQMIGMSDQALQQYMGGMQATAPMGESAQRMLQMGQGYLATSPQEQAQKYLQEQQALVNPQRAADLAELRANQAATGRAGLAIGGDAGMMAANPEMAAYYNAQRMQDLQMAANATQGGMDYARFGSSMMGTGADTLNKMYGTQTAALAPYQQALGGSQAIEGLGQGAFDLSTALGAKQATSGAMQGQMLQQGGNAAANSMFQANAYSPIGSALQGVGQGAMQYGGYRPQQSNYVTAGGQNYPTYAGSQQTNMLNAQW